MTANKNFEGARVTQEATDVPSLYNRADIYDLLEDESRFAAYGRHWRTILSGKNIKTLLDVSIGSGSVALPLGDLGIELSGSDLSEAMLENCRKKAMRRNYDITLKCSDFRDLSCWDGQVFDCVASTGNSLPYVPNGDIPGVLEQMDAHIKPNGWLYLDTRNWDKILAEKKRFYLYDPVFRDGNRVNLVQVWDYEPDGSMTFNLLYTFEKDGHIFQVEKFNEHYFPISRSAIVEKLEKLGYREIECRSFPAYADVDSDLADWYCIIARKT